MALLTRLNQSKHVLRRFSFGIVQRLKSIIISLSGVWPHLPIRKPLSPDRSIRSICHWRGHSRGWSSIAATRRRRKRIESGLGEWRINCVSRRGRNCLFKLKWMKRKKNEKQPEQSGKTVGANFHLKRKSETHCKIQMGSDFITYYVETAFKK